MLFSSVTRPKVKSVGSGRLPHVMFASTVPSGGRLEALVRGMDGAVPAGVSVLEGSSGTAAARRGGSAGETDDPGATLASRSVRAESRTHADRAVVARIQSATIKI